MPQIDYSVNNKQTKCPHCKQGVNLTGKTLVLGTNPVPPNKRSEDKMYVLTFLTCPLCGESTLELWVRSTHIGGGTRDKAFALYPRPTKYDYAPAVVPKQYKKDYDEAIQVLDISPNASSALSRRCLQSILRHECKIKGKGNLDKQIELYLKTNPPSYIKDTLHRIRKAGAIAVHPFTHKITGEIIDATPEIAEYTIVALQKLFDLLFVEPAMLKAQEAEIDTLYSEKSK